MKHIRYLLESALLHVAFFFFSLMPASAASDVGGWLGRVIGPRLAASRKAARNLERAHPALPENHERIVADMWENLGRTIAEYPHIKTIAGAAYTEIIGIEHLKGAEGGSLMFGGHLANWELGGPAFFVQHGIAAHPVYRAPNNPHVAALLDRCRMIAPVIQTIPKSRSGTRLLVDLVKAGLHVGILIDQKYNEGLPVPFFGRLAMTSPAVFQLAQKFSRPLIPVQVERVKGCRFRITIYPPLAIENKNALSVMTQANSLIEGWIRKNPGQWLWLHRRWDSKGLNHE